MLQNCFIFAVFAVNQCDKQRFCIHLYTEVHQLVCISDRSVKIGVEADEVEISLDVCTTCLSFIVHLIYIYID